MGNSCSKITLELIELIELKNDIDESKRLRMLLKLLLNKNKFSEETKKNIIQLVRHEIKELDESKSD
jgi:hypothetical protein